MKGVGERREADVARVPGFRKASSLSSQAVNQGEKRERGIVKEMLSIIIHAASFGRRRSKGSWQGFVSSLTAARAKGIEERRIEGRDLGSGHGSWARDGLCF